MRSRTDSVLLLFDELKKVSIALKHSGLQTASITTGEAMIKAMVFNPEVPMKLLLSEMTGLVLREVGVSVDKILSIRVPI